MTDKERAELAREILVEIDLNEDAARRARRIANECAARLVELRKLSRQLVSRGRGDIAAVVEDLRVAAVREARRGRS
jgi:hypothetical protein